MKSGGEVRDIYPKLNCWVKIETDEETGEICLVDELMEERFTVSRQAAALLNRLDGRTDPESVDCGMDRDELRAFLEDMEEEYLVSRGAFRKLCLGTGFLPLYTFPEHMNAAPARAVETVLSLIWFPLTLLGGWILLRSDLDVSVWALLAGMIPGLLIGVVLHEAGHTVSALAYGAKPYETGIMLSFFRPCAYVAVNQNQIRSRFGKTRFSLAGVRMNLLLWGLFMLPLWLCPGREMLAGICAVAGIENLVLGISNLTLMAGVDGCSALGLLLGNEDYVDDAVSLLRSRRQRREVRSLGLNGHAAILAACLACVSYLAVPALVALLIGGAVLWFR